MNVKDEGFNVWQAFKSRHLFWLKLMGRVGWGAKAVVYAVLGGLACDNAVGGQGSASPQVLSLPAYLSTTCFPFL
jgi:hypothetical protein